MGLCFLYRNSWSVSLLLIGRQSLAPHSLKSCCWPLFCANLISIGWNVSLAQLSTNKRAINRTSYKYAVSRHSRCHFIFKRRDEFVYLKEKNVFINNCSSESHELVLPNLLGSIGVYFVKAISFLIVVCVFVMIYLF